MPQSPVVALHRLLGFDQALLQRCNGTKIAADGHHPAFGTDLDRGIGHRQVDAAR